MQYSAAPLDLPGLQALRAYPHATIGRLVASDRPSRLIVDSGPCVFRKTSLSRLYANLPHRCAHAYLCQSGSCPI